MAISPSSSNSGATGSMKQIGKFMTDSVEKGRVARTQPKVKTEQQRVSRAEEEAAAERARERRAQEQRGGRLDVKA